MQVEFSRQPVAIEILEDTDELSSLSSYPVKVCSYQSARHLEVFQVLN